MGRLPDAQPSPRLPQRLLLTEPRRPVAVHESPRAHWYVVGTVCIGAFLGQLDASIVTIALPRLGRGCTQAWARSSGSNLRTCLCWSRRSRPSAGSRTRSDASSCTCTGLGVHGRVAALRSGADAGGADRRSGAAGRGGGDVAGQQRRADHRGDAPAAAGAGHRRAGHRAGGGFGARTACRGSVAGARRVATDLPREPPGRSDRTRARLVSAAAQPLAAPRRQRRSSRCCAAGARGRGTARVRLARQPRWLRRSSAAGSARRGIARRDRVCATRTSSRRAADRALDLAPPGALGRAQQRSCSHTWCCSERCSWCPTTCRPSTSASRSLGCSSRCCRSRSGSPLRSPGGS